MKLLFLEKSTTSFWIYLSYYKYIIWQLGKIRGFLSAISLRLQKSTAHFRKSIGAFYTYCWYFLNIGDIKFQWPQPLLQIYRYCNQNSLSHLAVTIGFWDIKNSLLMSLESGVAKWNTLSVIFPPTFWLHANVYVQSSRLVWNSRKMSWAQTSMITRLVII